MGGRGKRQCILRLFELTLIATKQCGMLLSVASCYRANFLRLALWHPEIYQRVFSRIIWKVLLANLGSNMLLHTKFHEASSLTSSDMHSFSCITYYLIFTAIVLAKAIENLKSTTSALLYTKFHSRNSVGSWDLASKCINTKFPEI